MTTTLLPGNKSGILSDCKAAKAAAPEGSTTRPALYNVFTALCKKKGFKKFTVVTEKWHVKIHFGCLITSNGVLERQTATRGGLRVCKFY